MKFSYVTCSLAVLLASAGGAFAQAPQVERNVSMGMAQAILTGALEQCAKDGYRVSVVVVDKAGQLAASIRGDGTGPATVETARLKAYTSRTRGTTSLEFAKATATGDNQVLRSVPGVIPLGGGVPIKVGNEVIGAVGVAGAPGQEKDEACALAGIEKVANFLKP